MRVQDHRLSLLLVICLVWLIYAAIAAPAGLYTDDEIIYAAMIDRFATSGSFIIENGYDVVPAESLRLVLMKAGPHGLTPQYPAGYAILAAPFYLAAGLQGVLFLNALASVLTLLLTYRIAIALFDDGNLAFVAALLFGLSTFAVDYAFAIWPHAAANLLTAAAIYATIRAANDSDTAWQWALAAGLCIGFGVTVRADIILAAPLLFVWLFINARRLLPSIIPLLGSLVMGLIVAAWLNYLKFGFFHPLSYGGSSLYGYARYLPFALPAGAALLSLRSRTIRTMLADRRGVAIIAAAVVMVLVLPGLRELSFKILRGLWVLIVDLKYLAVIDTHRRIQDMGDFYVYYGTLKKSLLQSLPYIGLAVFSAFAMFRDRRKAAYALCLLVPLAWFAPFAATEWIGGRANNLRYFSPVLPLLAILGAVGWRRIANDATRNTVVITLVGGLAAAAALLWAWWTSHPSPGIFQAFFVTGGTTWLGLAIVLISVAWIAFPATNKKMRLPAMIVLQASFFLAFTAGYLADAHETRKVRLSVAAETASFQFIEANAHVFSPGHFALYFLLNRPESTLAFYVQDDIGNDITFINRALDQGRPVYIATLGLTRIVRQALVQAGYPIGPEGFSIRAAPSPVDGRNVGLYRIIRSESVK